MGVEIDGKSLEVVAVQLPAAETVVVSESVPEVVLENPINQIVVDSSIYAINIPLPGESAYDVAVRNGFNGTEEEWLESLSGGTEAASWDTIIGRPSIIAYGETAEEARDRINAQVAGEYATAAQGEIAESALQPDELPDDLVKDADPRLSDAREPLEHTHTYDDIIDPPYIPQTPGDVGAQPAGDYVVPDDIDDVVRDGDSRLTDTRDPKDHQHPIEDVDGLESELAGKQPAGDYIVEGDARLSDARQPTSHRHDYDEIDGTPDIPSVPSDIGAQPAGDYATNTALTSGLDGKANTSHTHAIAQVTGLQGALNDKQAAGEYVEEGDPRLEDARTPLSHRHPYSEIDDTPDLNALPYRSNTWNPDLSSKADVDHSHSVSDVTGLSNTINDLQTDIDGKQPAGEYATAEQGAKADTALQAGDIVGVPDNVVLDDDPRMTDARTPLAHDHDIGDVNGLQAELNAKQQVGDYVLNTDSRLTDARTPTEHTHDYDDLNGTPDIPATPGDIGAQPAGDYATNTALTSGLAGKANTSHNHSITNVTGLQSALDGKAGSEHSHTIANVTGLQSALNAKQAAGDYAIAGHSHDYDDLDNLPDIPTTPGDIGAQPAGSYATTTALTSGLAGKANTTHNHTLAQVTGLQGALDGKAAATHSHTIGNVTGLQTALDSKQASGNYAIAGHTHDYDDLDGLPDIPSTPADIGAQPAGSYAAASHTHAITGVTGLQAALDGKQASGSYAAASHSHTIANVTGLQGALDGKQASGNYVLNTDSRLTNARPPTAHTHSYDDLDDKPSIPSTPGDIGAQPAGSYATTTALTSGLAGKANTSHNHTLAQVTGLQSALDGKQASGNYALSSHTHSYDDLSNKPSIPSAPGDIGAQPAGNYALSSHTHTIANVTGLSTQLSGKADASHGHDVDDVDGLQDALDAKQPTGSYVLTSDSRLTNARTPLAHTHTIANVTGLQAAIDGKQAAGSYAAASHTHTIANVSGLQTALNGKQASGSYAAASHTHDYDDLDGLPSIPSVPADIGAQPAGSYAAASHSHTITNVTGLQAALDAKQASGSYAAASHSHAISNVTGLQSALDGKQASGSYVLTSDSRLTNARPPTAHTHSYNDLTNKPSIPTSPGDIGAQPSGSYAAASHTHTIANVTNLQTTLNGKAASSHTHSIGQVTGLQAALNDLSVPDVTMIYYTGSVWINAEGVTVSTRPNAKRVLAFGATSQPSFLQSGDIWSAVAAVV